MNISHISFFLNFRIQLLTLTLLLYILGKNCELTESVIFQPIDDIQTSKSSWIFSTAVDFTPYDRYHVPEFLTQVQPLI